MFDTFIDRVTIGLLLGSAVTFLTMAGATAAAAVLATQVWIPGVFTVLVDQEHGLPLVEFTPNPVGLATMAAGIAVLYLLMRSRPRTQER